MADELKKGYVEGQKETTAADGSSLNQTDDPLVSFRSGRGHGRAEGGIPEATPIGTAIYTPDEGNARFTMNVVDYPIEKGSIAYAAFIDAAPNELLA